MKNIYLLGATGSIGTQTLQVLRSLDESYRLVSMCFGSKLEEAIKIIDEFHPKLVCTNNESNYNFLKNKYNNIDILYGDDNLINVATCKYYDDGEDIVINSLVGMIGLTPTIEAIKKGRTILLANKETLVVGGEIITKLIKEYNTKMLPIDSEHSAIFQCLEGRKKEEVKKLIITASGGAFRELSREQLNDVTIDDALKHPNWLMGKKITVDCASMVNKGLEVIEAHFLFDIDYDNIDTIIHKESIIHSMVEYKDNTIIAQLGKADMRVPIQYAITYPDKINYKLDSSLDFNTLNNLTFKKMDYERYPLLKVAYEVGKLGGLKPTIFNASNEEAVKLFIEKKIKFLDIETIIIDCVNNFENIISPTLDQILKCDKQVREYVINKYGDSHTNK